MLIGVLYPMFYPNLSDNNKLLESASKYLVSKPSNFLRKFTFLLCKLSC